MKLMYIINIIKYKNHLNTLSFPDVFPVWKPVQELDVLQMFSGLEDAWNTFCIRTT